MCLQHLQTARDICVLTPPWSPSMNFVHERWLCRSVWFPHVKSMTTWRGRKACYLHQHLKDHPNIFVHDFFETFLMLNFCIAVWILALLSGIWLLLARHQGRTSCCRMLWFSLKLSRLSQTEALFLKCQMMKFASLYVILRLQGASEWQRSLSGPTLWADFWVSLCHPKLHLGLPAFALECIISVWSAWDQRLRCPCISLYWLEQCIVIFSCLYERTSALPLHREVWRQALQFRAALVLFGLIPTLQTFFPITHCGNQWILCARRCWLWANMLSKGCCHTTPLSYQYVHEPHWIRLWDSLRYEVCPYRLYIKGQ